MYKRQDPDYETAFCGKKINLHDLVIRTDEQPMEPIHKQTKHNLEIHMFERPKEGCEYVMSADTSEGKGGDNGTMTIYNKTDMAVAVTARGNRTEIEEFTDIYIALAMKYNTLNGPEDDGKYGRDIMKAVRDAGLKRYVSPGELKKKKYRKYGYIPSHSRNAERLTCARRNTKNIEVRCPRLLQEINDYDWFAEENDGRDSSGGHFDLLVSYMICVYIAHNQVYTTIGIRE